jgi:hypothetical protein
VKIAPLLTAIVLCVVSAGISASGDVKRDVAQAAHELLRVTGYDEPDDRCEATNPARCPG